MENTKSNEDLYTVHTWHPNRNTNRSIHFNNFWLCWQPGDRYSYWDCHRNPNCKELEKIAIKNE